LGVISRAEAARKRTAGRDERRWRSELRLRIEGQTVFLDGEPVFLDMTDERKESAIYYLEYLLSAFPGWLTDSEVKKAEEQRKGGLPDIRWDHVRRKLPKCILDLIETNRRKGSRFLESLRTLRK
jgi:hypothetical protein